MKKAIYGTGLFFLLTSLSAFGWNALGHRLVAQIAYDNMTRHARDVFKQYNHAMDKIYKPQSFTNAAVWLDTLRYQEINWYNAMHYVDLPFSEEGWQLPPPQTINALWAIEKSSNLLLNKYATDFDKGTAFRVILHVVADIHQPLHAATRVSAEYPKGDRGGNLVSLGQNPIAKNLHAYWDQGAGLLRTQHRYSPSQLTRRAASIERRWPCDVERVDTNPRHWAKESHALATNTVYKKLSENNVPNKQYQQITQKIAEQRIALAGCRLAALLNQLDQAMKVL